MKLRHLATAVATLFVAVHSSSAQSTATQDVTITVQAVDDISVSAPTVSITVGVVFGIVPAWRAAKQDPVVCLRYE